MDQIHAATLSNGLCILVEPMSGSKSVGLKLVFPAGAAHDAPGKQGVCAMLEEYMLRGAGGMTSRQHSDALDRVGVQRSTHAGTRHLSLSGVCVGDRLSEVLPLVTCIATDLALDPAQLDACRSLCLQSLDSLRDDPQERVMLELRRHHMPPPYNRSGYGEKEDLEMLLLDDVHGAWSHGCVPGGSILGIAGAVDPHTVFATLETLLADWEGSCDDPVDTAPPARGMAHIQEPTAQVHLGIAWDAPSELHEHSMVERLAIGVLSGGMSGRLFTEVRERRSLCYSVSASYSAGKDRGLVSLYAGTTPERAQDTLTVCLSEIERLRGGVTPQEFHRAVIGLKSRLIMQGESTQARAAALCRDQYRIGRARTLDEVADAVDAVTIEQLNAYLRERSFGPFTVATIGPDPLIMPEPALSAGPASGS